MSPLSLRPSGKKEIPKKILSTLERKNSSHNNSSHLQYFIALPCMALFPPRATTHRRTHRAGESPTHRARTYTQQKPSRSSPNRPRTSGMKVLPCTSDCAQINHRCIDDASLYYGSARRKPRWLAHVTRIRHQSCPPAILYTRLCPPRGWRD